MMGGFTAGWMWLWPALIVAGLLVIAYVVVRLTQDRRASGGTPSDHGTARRILDERYARGEIDDEEYQRRRAALS